MGENFLVTQRQISMIFNSLTLWMNNLHTEYHHCYFMLLTCCQNLSRLNLIFFLFATKSLLPQLSTTSPHQIIGWNLAWKLTHLCSTVDLASLELLLKSLLDDLESDWISRSSFFYFFFYFHVKEISHPIDKLYQHICLAVCMYFSIRKKKDPHRHMY